MEMTKKMKMAAVGAAAVAVVGGGVFAYTRLAGGDPNLERTQGLRCKMDFQKTFLLFLI